MSVVDIIQTLHKHESRVVIDSESVCEVEVVVARYRDAPAFDLVLCL